jgi:hypothetical protein
VQQEVVTACQRSIDAPGYQPTTNTYAIRHKAAALAWVMGNHARATSSAWSARRGWRIYKSVRKHLGVA